MKRDRFRIVVALTILLLLIAFGYNRLIPSGKKVSSSQNPKGCASCHNSLTAQLKNIEGHPPVPVESVTDCLNCHEEGNQIFSNGLHKGHYKGQNKFETEYNGSCVNCHKLSEKGDVVIPGLAPKGTKYVTIKVANIVVSPGGCAGCHKKKYAILDYNLKKMVNKLPNHPKIDFEDFNKCYNCHGQSVPGLATVLHAKHLKNIVYQKMYANSCINCHQLKSDGSVIVKGKKE